MDHPQAKHSRCDSTVSFLDAIHHQLGTDEKALENDVNAVSSAQNNERLKRIQTLNATIKKQLKNVEACRLRAPITHLRKLHESLYEISLENEQKLERTEPEVLLALLIAQHLDTISDGIKAPSQSTSPPLTGNEPLSPCLELEEPDEPAEAHVPEVLDVKEIHRDKRAKNEETTQIIGDVGPNHLIKSFHENNCDFQAIKDCFGREGSTQQHQLLILSGSQFNCWWRAAWVSLLCQHAADQINGHLCQNIHNFIQHLEHNPKVEQSFERFSYWLSRKKPFRSFLTEQDSAFQPYPSHLKYPNESDNAQHTQAESDIAVLTFVILTSLGLDEETIYQQTFDPRVYGEASVMTGLISLLGGTGIVLSKSQGFLMVDEKTDQFNTSNVLEKTQLWPVIKYSREHFDIYLPMQETPSGVDERSNFTESDLYT